MCRRIWWQVMLRTSPWGVSKTSWAQVGPRSNTQDLWRRWWEGPSDPYVGEALGVGNVSHPQRLRVMRVRRWAMHSSWCEDSRMLENTSIGGVSEEICKLKWGVVPGQHPRQPWPESGSWDCGGLNEHNFLNSAWMGQVRCPSTFEWNVHEGREVVC